jgi:iron complex outermembrane receptor protein
MMFYRKKTVVLAIGLCFALSARAQDTADIAAAPAMTVGVVTVVG